MCCLETSQLLAPVAEKTNQKLLKAGMRNSGAGTASGGTHVVILSMPFPPRSHLLFKYCCPISCKGMEYMDLVLDPSSEQVTYLVALGRTLHSDTGPSQRLPSNPCNINNGRNSICSARVS